MELQVYRDPKEGPMYREFYEKLETDKVIDKFKDEIDVLNKKLMAYSENNAKLLNENTELKVKLEGAGMRERRLQRALYKACANWAHEAKFDYDDEFSLWENMERKCLRKVEQFKEDK